jgi:predicted unusual protein kinase regulating ubiquinone biosynthesis (AarF/ABC1/UbiB family)
MDVHDVEERIAKNGDCPEVELDGTLLGAGAIAQVYKGRLPDGQAVAVKALRRGVEERIALDLELLSGCREMLAYWFPKIRYLGLEEALYLFERAMMDQTDLQVEAAHSRRFDENFGRHAYIRTPALLFAGHDLLVMEYVEGSTVSSLVAHGGAYFEKYRKEIWGVLGDMMGHMLVRDNLVHSDLHPGNIAVVANADGIHHEARAEWWRPIKEALPDQLVATFEVNGIGRPEPNFSIYLLDTGLVTELSGKSKDVFRRMIKAL